MPKFHLITEKLSKNIRLKILSKNTAAFSTRISKISRENHMKECTLSRFFAFLINAVVLLDLFCLEQIKDEIGVILEVDPLYFLHFSLSFLMFISIFIKFKR